MASGIVESSNQGNEGKEQSGSTGLSRSKLVQRLSASSANLPAFINDLIHTQAVVVAGTEAAAFLIERAAPATEGGEPTFALRAIAHIRPDNSSPETRTAAIQAFQDLIQPCITQGKDGALEVGGAGDTVDPQFCLVTLLRNEGDVVAASAVITRCPNVERAQQRLMSMQLVAGYFDLYTLKRTSEQSKTIAQSHQHVLQLATAVATATGFQAAAMNLCNELATRTGSTRVSIGWMKGEKIRVKSLSHTEEFDKRQELIVQLERAMEECYDQEEIVQYEPDGQSSPNVTREHQALSRAQGSNTVLSIPLRRQADIIGVMTLEFAPGQRLGPQAAQGLSVAADLLAPQLYDRFQNDRWLITKTGISIRENSKLVMGPKHMLAKLICTLILGAVVFITFFQPVYHVNAPFALGANEKRYVAAPFEGFIHKVNVNPGDRIKKGDVLFELNTHELMNQKAEAMGRKNEADKEAQRARYDAESQRGLKPTREADARIAEAKSEAAAAEIAIIQGKIDRSAVKADIDGVVLDMGELKYKIGAPVKLGDQLMVIGAADDLYAELRVPERDIQDVQESWKSVDFHGVGELAVSSAPTEKIPFKIERVIPQTEAKEGETYYKVIVQLDPTSKKWKPQYTKDIAKWLPLMEGEARIDIGNRRLAWIWTHRFVDWTRLHLWSNPVFAPFFK